MLKGIRDLLGEAFSNSFVVISGKPIDIDKKIIVVGGEPLRSICKNNHLSYLICTFLERLEVYPKLHIG